MKYHSKYPLPVIKHVAYFLQRMGSDLAQVGCALHHTLGRRLIEHLNDRVVAPIFAHK